MTIPASPPRRYTTSRQLIAGDDFNNLSDVYSFQQLVCGANAQNSAKINASNVELITAAAGAATLPIAIPGQDVAIFNNSGQTQAIFKNS